MRIAIGRLLLPAVVGAVLVSASLAETQLLSAPSAAASRSAAPSSSLVPAPAGPAASGPSGASLTEGELRAALPGASLLRVEPGELGRMAALNAHRGVYLTGPALAAVVAASRDEGADGGDDAWARRTRLCRQPDSLREKVCLDSLARVYRGPAAGYVIAGEDSAARAPRALREQGRADSVSPRAREGRDLAAFEDDPEDELQTERQRGYISQFFIDLRSGDWDWDTDDWAAVIYVVVGLVVVGAFVLVGGKALYDLVVNKERAPVFQEAGLRFSWSGRTFRDGSGARLYRDSWLGGARYAFGLEKDVLALGLAVEGGMVNLAVSGLPGRRDALDVHGAYLVGGPMVRFGTYHPLAFTMEFLNGTSNHRSIGWISKARMALMAKTGAGLLWGGHIGAVFHDLEYSDGLVFRDGDFNRDLSLMAGLDLGWAF